MTSFLAKQCIIEKYSITTPTNISQVSFQLVRGEFLPALQSNVSICFVDADYEWSTEIPVSTFVLKGNQPSDLIWIVLCCVVSGLCCVKNVIIFHAITHGATYSGCQSLVGMSNFTVRSRAPGITTGILLLWTLAVLIVLCLSVMVLKK